MSYITVTYPGMIWAEIIIDALVTDRQSPEHLAELNQAINDEMDKGYNVHVKDKVGSTIGAVPRTRP